MFGPDTEKLFARIFYGAVAAIFALGGALGALIMWLLRRHN